MIQRLLNLSTLAAVMGLMGGCSGGNSPDPYTVANTFEEALALTRNFKRVLVESESGPDTVPIRTFQSARLGNVCILNECGTEFDSLQGSCENVYARFPNLAMDFIATPLGNSMVAFEWSSSFSREVKVELDFLERAVKAAFSDEEVKFLRITLSVIDAELIEINNAPVLEDNYYAALDFGGDRAYGNVLVAGLVRGRVRMVYEALDRFGENVELSASFLVNQINIAAGGGYVETASASGNIIQESPDSGSVFAVVKLNIDPVRQDQVRIAQQRSGVCEDPGFVQRGTPKIIPGVDTNDGEPIALLNIEVTEDESGCEIWDLSVEHDDPLGRSFTIDYVLRVFNLLGQNVHTHTWNTGRLDPGETSFEGDIKRGFGSLCDLRLSEATIEVVSFAKGIEFSL